MARHEVIDLTESSSEADPEAFEEEQLAAAIALSLAELKHQQEHPTTPSSRSLEQQKDVQTTNSSSHASRSPSVDSSVVDLTRNIVNSNDSDVGASSSSNSAAPPMSEFLRERAALEKARLERQKRSLDASMDSSMQSQTPGAGPSSMPDGLVQRPGKRAYVLFSGIPHLVKPISLTA